MYNNYINGGAGKGGGGRGTLSSMDFYRRVPKDLTEVSILHIYFLLRLFVRAYDVYVAVMCYSNISLPNYIGCECSAAAAAEIIIAVHWGGEMIDYWRAVREYYLVVTFHPNKKQHARTHHFSSIHPRC